MSFFFYFSNDSIAFYIFVIELASVLDFGGEKSFKETIERDKKKLILCKENNIKLLYYDSEHGNTEFLGEKVYNNENNIIKEITSYEQKN